MGRQHRFALDWITAGVVSMVLVALCISRWTLPGGVWRDETACIQLALLPTIGNIWANFEHEAFPPPFPQLVRTYVALFGRTDFALHGFGFAVCCLILISIWGASFILLAPGERRSVLSETASSQEIIRPSILSGAWPPVLSLALFGLNSSFLIWGAVVRGYGLAAAAIVLHFACLGRFRSQPSWRWWVWSVITGVLSVQCALQNCFLVLAIGLSAVLVSLLRKELRTAVLSLSVGLIAAVSTLYFLPRFLQIEWKIVVEGYLTLKDYVFGLLYQMGNPDQAVIWVWGGLILICLCGGIWKTVQATRRVETSDGSLQYGLFVLILSLVLFLFFLRYLHYSMRPWYFVPLLALLACNLEMMLARLMPVRFFQLFRCVLTVLLLAALTVPAYRETRTRMTNMDLIASRLEELAGPDDLIVVSPWYYGVSLNWYYHGSTRVESLPIIGRQPIHRYDLVMARMKSTEPLEDLKEEIRQTLANGHRVWVVGRLLPVPRQGPRSYGPAPDPVAKWSENEYMGSWLEQMTAFLQRVSRSQTEIEIPVDSPVSRFEKLQLWRIER